MRWAPDGESLVFAATTPQGDGEINRLDVARLSVERLESDVLVAPGAIDVADDNKVYFGRLGDPSVMVIEGSSVNVALTPPFEVWSHLSWSRGRLWLVDDSAEKAAVDAVDLEGGAAEEKFATRDRIDSVWSDVEGRALLISHKPYPEEDLKAGSVLTLILDDRQTDLPLDPLTVAISASLAPDESTVFFVESNTHRLGSLRLSDRSIEWIATDVDGADVSARGRIATLTRTPDPLTDTVCFK